MTSPPARPVRRRLLSALLAACAFLAACQSLPPAPTDRFYRLADATPTVAAQQWTDGSIAIQEMRADGPYLDRAIVFTHQQRAAQVESYRYAFWIYAPPRLIQQHMIRFLRANRLAPTIIDEDSGDEAAFVISGRILRFEQMLSSDTAHADVELELQVASAGRRQPLLRKTYRAAEPAADQSVDAFVQSMGRAMDRICAAFAKDLISTPGQTR
jgi:ABC-type uncharacterized transport system auxiliary subunit